MTTPVLPWIPDRHLDVVATLAHADELIGQVGELVFEYVAENGDVFKICEVLDDSVSNAVIERIAPIAKKIPLLVADALVTLRAAIEYTLFTEVGFLSERRLDDKQERNIGMPAYNTYAEYARWLKKRPKNTPDVIANGSELLRRVEGLQPFHRAVRPDLHPLALLTLYTNHAKHRTPAVTAVRLAAVVNEKVPPRSPSDFEPGPVVPIRVGDVIAKTPLGERVPVALFPAIGINRPGTEDWPYLMDELDQISSWVREQAVPRLITGGSPPSEGIPASYEIGRGHDGERDAIGLGTSITANEKARLRHGAASARPSMVEMLLPTSAELTRETLAKWVAHLNDGEVVERVERFKGFVSDFGSMSGNAKVLSELRDEALQFASKHRG
ncbi:hypothetical protein [Brevibacterium sp. RIT 803]|uniref:hypothetical protein n=1 Tax=Brevibacterium sp. RIT 803 TaxID=2810210 RepID=UPI001952039A|nr:hypothetical protein [Brevibacterium sp. RIT 803]MBM6588425.1 hypothetical protein [Brevibacterium sp. RIT 803]